MQNQLKVYYKIYKAFLNSSRVIFPVYDCILVLAWNTCLRTRINPADSWPTNTNNISLVLSGMNIITIITKKKPTRTTEPKVNFIRLKSIILSAQCGIVV